jgi:putative FmdB family regulatory protein
VRYDYFCEQCQVTEERNVPVDARDEQLCVRCGTKLKRLLSRPYFRIPRSFRNAPSDEEFFTPIWQPVRYGVSKRELMKEYDQAIETLRKPPDWLKRLREWEAEGKFSMVDGSASFPTPLSEFPPRDPSSNSNASYNSSENRQESK